MPDDMMLTQGNVTDLIREKIATATASWPKDYANFHRDDHYKFVGHVSEQIMQAIHDGRPIAGDLRERALGDYLFKRVFEVLGFRWVTISGELRYSTTEYALHSGAREEVRAALDFDDEEEVEEMCCGVRNALRNSDDPKVRANIEAALASGDIEKVRDVWGALKDKETAETA